MAEQTMRLPATQLATEDKERGTPSHERARQPLSIASRQTSTAQAMQALWTTPRPAPWKSGRVAIKAHGVILLIDPAEVLVAEAQGNYVLLQQAKGSHLLREQMSVLAEKLQPYGFIRIHRSVLVNAEHVETMGPHLSGEYLVRMKSGKEYKVSRTYRKNLQLLAETWLGAGSFIDE